MHIVGLITEYNPFHNGHAYHIKKAKEITQADYVIVVMSGNYVQRGTPAMLDKYTRTKMALQNGADIVLELPVYYATSSAEGFAQGAIRILNDLGIVDSICFGSESGDITLLSTIAKSFLNESEEFKLELMKNIKAGCSYPIARSNALISNIAEPTCEFTKEQIAQVLTCSNNILGIEYIKAIKLFKSSITPYTIQRVGHDYNNTDLHSEFSSASALRAKLMSGQEINLEHIQEQMPVTAFHILNDYCKQAYPICENDFSDILFYSLYSTNVDVLANYLDMNMDLANRLVDMGMKYHNYTSVAEVVKTKQYTLTRINRALLHIILQITTDNYKELTPTTTSSYARLLGFRKGSSTLLKTVRKQGAIPIITKVADYKQLLDKKQCMLFEKDLFATHLYNQVVASRSKHVIPSEFIQGPIRVE